ncbi:hypothetical protein DQ04_00441070 [Trypanosoma grayi]|uniref:hypothetical protein n=1 Tax=Trypanosoma grayi TaxID=71804 RepID=UPI0004F3EFED|nr:hypothetical protein DQ04_00441070 [Trypanosoma grayi]KEG14482.1 hypothetical protein DQ04_00441070 [Trypanosoma grayi]
MTSVLLHLLSPFDDVVQEMRLAYGGLTFAGHRTPSSVSAAVVDDVVAAHTAAGRCGGEHAAVLVGKTAVDRLLRPLYGAPSHLLRRLAVDAPVARFSVSVVAFSGDALDCGRPLAHLLRPAAGGGGGGGGDTLARSHKCVVPVCSSSSYVFLETVEELDAVVAALVASPSFNDHVERLSLRVSLAQLQPNGCGAQCVFSFWFINDRHLWAMQHHEGLQRESVRSVAVVAADVGDACRYLDRVKCFNTAALGDEFCGLTASCGARPVHEENWSELDLSSTAVQMLLDVLEPIVGGASPAAGSNATVGKRLTGGATSL